MSSQNKYIAALHYNWAAIKPAQSVVSRQHIVPHCVTTGPVCPPPGGQVPGQELGRSSQSGRAVSRANRPRSVGGQAGFNLRKIWLLLHLRLLVQWDSLPSGRVRATQHQGVYIGLVWCVVLYSVWCMYT